MNTKQPFLGMLEKRGEHWVHGLECREPFVKRPEFVDAHSNVKKNERVVNLSCISTWKYAGHLDLPLRVW